MESESYMLNQQLEKYKSAISDAMIQFQLDDESRIAAARAVLNSAMSDYKETQDIQCRDYIRATIDGMLKISAVCHLISIDELKEYKRKAGIKRIEVPIRKHSLIRGCFFYFAINLQPYCNSTQINSCENALINALLTHVTRYAC